MKWKPFITEELNNLDLKASLITIMTIYGGLFSSVCGISTLQQILMALIIMLNSYFLALFVKKFIQIKLSFAEKSKFTRLVSNIIEKFWKKGQFFFLNDSH
jgi:hypothetical protein